MVVGIGDSSVECQLDATAETEAEAEAEDDGLKCVMPNGNDTSAFGRWGKWCGKRILWSYNNSRLNRWNLTFRFGQWSVTNL